MRKITALIVTLALCVSTLSAQVKDSVRTQSGYEKFRFGGYGEMIASFKDYGINRLSGSGEGNAKFDRNTISIPRFVLGFDYKFSSKWLLSAEIEFESGGTGMAFEIENSENGEYETEIEKGGEVALEQFHITRLIIPQFNIRAGHLIVPIGLTNAHHEPINFFGTSRPQSQTAFLPSTWHETGIEVYGSIGKINYQAMIVAGLNANGFERDTWIAAGKQGYFEEDNFTSPGYVTRVDYTGIRGLRTGISMYYCRNAGSNSDKVQTYASIGRIPVAIGSWDAQYRNKYLTVRADLVYGYIGKAAAVTAINKQSLSNKSPYSRLGPVAKNALSYGMEAGVDISALIKGDCPKLVPYARYDYYNPQERGQAGQTMDHRFQVSQWQGGVNWFALPNLVIKAEYSTRQIGTNKVFGKGMYNSENEFSVGIAYIGWFINR